MKFKLFGKLYDTSIKKKEKRKKDQPKCEKTEEKPIRFRLPRIPSGANFIGFFIGLMVIVIVAVSVVIPVIQTQVTEMETDGTKEKPGGSALVTFLNILPLFIVLAILVSVVSMMRF
jgi:hypothetical protein